jgi:hypothetical protein
VFFVIKMHFQVWAKMWVNRLTHTVTHTRKCPDGFEEYRRGDFAFSPVFLMFFFCLHYLRHEAAHGLCGFILLLPCGVGVGSQGESRIVVAEHTADSFHIHAVL